MRRSSCHHPVAVHRPGATSAQNQTGRLTVTVNDTTGGSLPTATVTVTGLDPANKALNRTAQQTETTGIVNFDGLAPGRYAVVAEFTGFETSPPRGSGFVPDKTA